MREKPMEKRENGVRVEHLTGALPMSEMLEKYVDVEKFLGYCAAPFASSLSGNTCTAYSVTAAYCGQTAAGSKS